jgi:hypothetical protein
MRRFFCIDVTGAKVCRRFGVLNLLALLPELMLERYNTRCYYTILLLVVNGVLLFFHVMYASALLTSTTSSLPMVIFVCLPQKCDPLPARRINFEYLLLRRCRRFQSIRSRKLLELEVSHFLRD